MAKTKEVYFDQYCLTCKYSDLSEYQDPCWDCMEEPMNYDSHKPHFWEEGKVLAQNLRKLRIELGLTIGKCADDMRVDRQTIINIEQGRTKKESSIKRYELYLEDVRRKREVNA